jgi:hypothetical protein
MYLLPTPAPDEGIIFSSFFPLDIAVLKDMRGVLGSIGIFVIIL